MTTDSAFLAGHHNIRLDSVQDALTLIGSGLGSGLGPLIFTRDDLADDFFDLPNGKAGAVFQKFINYGVRAAFVIPDDHQLGERVTELAREYANHRQIRISESIASAQKWLATLNR